MANLGKIFLFTMILLFGLKALCTGVVPILKSDQQLLVLEESQENEESDDSYKLKFVDEFIELHHPDNLCNDVHFRPSKKAYSCYNAALFIGHKNKSFRPPCA